MMITAFVLVLASAASPLPNHPATEGGARPTIVPRTSWDKRLAQDGPPKLAGVTRYRGDLKNVLDGIVVHHSDFVDAPGPGAILDYHLDVNHWSDIGYHFVIGIDGTIYEGRAIDALGAHAGQSREANRAVAAARREKRGAGAVDAARRLDPDYGAIGIVLDGYFHDVPPPDVQWAALDRLISHLRAKYNIARNAVIGHRDVRHVRVQGRGLTVTGPRSVCPGDAGYARLLTWRIGALTLPELLQPPRADTPEHELKVFGAKALPIRGARPGN